MQKAKSGSRETVKHYRRHKFLILILRGIAAAALRLIMGYRCKREKISLDAKSQEPYIVIANHNTDLDPALVVIGLGHMYFVASEHAFRKGFSSKLLKFVFDPIPINKVKPDPSTLKEIFRRIKAGFSVGLFAEGNRSHNGLTQQLTLATAKMVKISGAGLLTYRLEGGYFTSPRWSKKMRKGKMTGSVTGRYSAAEIKAMSNEEILKLIEKGIYEDAYARQKENPIPYRGKDIAEHIETALYLCPSCSKSGTIHSKGNRFFCDCGLEGIYTETGFLESTHSEPHLPFSTITEWDTWQVKQLTAMLRNAGDNIICTDANQRLFTVDPATGSKFTAEGTMSISRTEFQCAGMTFPLQQITQFAIVEQMTMLFALKDGRQFEIRSDSPRSVIKYLEILRILRG